MAAIVPFSHITTRSISLDPVAWSRHFIGARVNSKVLCDMPREKKEVRRGARRNKNVYSRQTNRSTRGNFSGKVAAAARDKTKDMTLVSALISGLYIYILLLLSSYKESFAGGSTQHHPATLASTVNEQQQLEHHQNAHTYLWRKMLQRSVRPLLVKLPSWLALQFQIGAYLNYNVYVTVLSFLGAICCSTLNIKVWLLGHAFIWILDICLRQRGIRLMR